MRHTFALGGEPQCPGPLCTQEQSRQQPALGGAPCYALVLKLERVSSTFDCLPESAYNSLADFTWR